MRVKLVLAVLVLAVVGGLVTLLYAQNLNTAASLTLNLGFAAWKLQDPVPVVLLMGTSLGAGLLVGGGWALLRVSGLARKVRRLEHDLALQESKQDVGSWG